MLALLLFSAPAIKKILSNGGRLERGLEGAVLSVIRFRSDGVCHLDFGGELLGGELRIIPQVGHLRSPVKGVCHRIVAEGR
jgi:hypothetical protein